jgi:hypothetical protein
MKSIEDLTRVLELVRQYPDFDGGGPLADAMDQALRGEPVPLLDTIDSLAHGEYPTAEVQHNKQWFAYCTAKDRIKELEPDAIRYRWLRDNKHLDIWWSVSGPSDRAQNIDADIDAAIEDDAIYQPEQGYKT